MLSKLPHSVRRRRAKLRWSARHLGALPLAWRRRHHLLVKLGIAVEELTINKASLR